MKRLTILFMLFLTSCILYAKDRKGNDLSGPIALKGELTEKYQNYTKGTPVVIRGVRKMRISPDETAGITYAVEIDGLQYPVGAEEAGKIIRLKPATVLEYWQGVYLSQGMYDYYNRKGYRYKMRQELDEECLDYLDKLNEIAYKDAYIQDYVQAIFAKVNPGEIDTNRPERLNVRIIQSPEPDAYMLPNGTMLVSTGLLCTIDSEEELEAIIANEMVHFILDHQVDNVSRAETRAKRAAFWADVLGTVAMAADDTNWMYGYDERVGAIELAASIGTIAALINVRTVNRLGMDYSSKQELQADRIARDYLAFKGMNPNALSSAINKIKEFYGSVHRYDNLTRYGSYGLLKERLAKLGETESIHSHMFEKMTSDIVTFNAAMYQGDKRYKMAEQLAQKNIDNRVASDHDYVILVKARMAQENTPESNEACMKLLEKAREIATARNLDINKQEILLLMRMNKQAKAADKLKEYLDLLAEYKQQNDMNTQESEWIGEELDWASKMLSKISLL